MKRIALILITALLSSSCATILKTKSYELNVSSDQRNSQVQIHDSVYSLPAKVEVKRSKHDLKMLLISDSSKVDFVVRSAPNPTFLYWNLIGFYTCPIFYGVDLTNSKRFYYGKSVYLNTRDTVRFLNPPTRQFWNDFFSEKHNGNRKDFNLTLSIPYVNGFNFEPEDFGTKVNTGYWGLSVGLEYFYRADQYMKLKFVAASDFWVPVPAAVTPADVRESLHTSYGEITNNWRFGKIDLGLGLNYCRNNWTYIDETDIDNSIVIRRRRQSLGLTANSYLQVSKVFFIGLVYRPTFVEVHPSFGYQYEHLISLDFEFKIPLNK